MKSILPLVAALSLSCSPSRWPARRRRWWSPARSRCPIRPAPASTTSARQNLSACSSAPSRPRPPGRPNRRFRLHPLRHLARGRRGRTAGGTGDRGSIQGGDSTRDQSRYQPILALRINGHPLEEMGFSPWMMYPLNDFRELQTADIDAKLAWRVKTLVVR